jgi:hypothetical protein
MSKEYYERVAALGQYILNRINEFKPDISLEDNMQSAITLGPNPYRPAIEDDGSLLIEFSYGLPARFYTPLGGFDFCGEGIISEGRNEVGARVAAELVSKFDLCEVFSAKKTGQKHVGPILSVGKDIKGNTFADVHIEEVPKGKSYDDEIDFEERRQIWNELKPDYEKIKEQARKVNFETE